MWYIIPAMRIKILILNVAILIASMAGIAPEPAQNRATRPAAQNKEGKAEQSNSPAAASPETKLSPETKAPAPEVSNESIHIEKTEVEWLSTVFNGLGALGTVALAVIGFITARIALRSLQEIEEQTKAAKIAAEAALKSAETSLNASRPWLLIPMGAEFSEIGEPFLPAVGNNRACHVTFQLRNFGQMPARITEQKTRLYIGTNPDDVPDTAAFNDRDSVSDDYVIPPGSVIPVQAYLEPQMYISGLDRSGVIAGAKFLWLCGFIKYGFASDSRAEGPTFETRVCYLWMNRTTRDKPFWIIRGPREFSRAT